MTDTPDPICPLCFRPIPRGAKQSLHHLIPRLKGGKRGPTVLLHQICHNEIHATLTEAELAREFSTPEALRAHPRLATFLRWVAKRPPEFHARSTGRRRKRQRRGNLWPGWLVDPAKRATAPRAAFHSEETAMRLRGTRRSRNIEDRRRMGGGAKAGGIGGVGLLVVLAIGYFTGIDVTPLLQGTGMTQSPAGATREISPEEERAAQFSAQVLATTEDVWSEIYPVQTGESYDPPVLVLFSGVTQSPCGGASGATGPFYCPADEKAYLDTAFFATMSQELGAGGDFAAAYVIAHEVAHHIQNELGILGQVQQARQRSSEREANALTVRLELQADCLSGVWAQAVQGLLEPGDIDEALNAARRIGDDYLQRRAGRVPNPHTFTHGTSEQRSSWFARGYESGDMGACDTFAADRL